jgi:hypothetical protein
VERWEAPVDPRLYALSGPVGAETLLAGNGRDVSHLLGQGARCRRVCGRVGPGASLAPIRPIGVDEILYAKGHKYLTLVYQLDQGITRLLWVGKERTIESFEGFFTLIGDTLTAQIAFVCSDMWQPYLDVISQQLLPGAAHPRPLPHRRQDEQGVGRGARRRVPHYGPGGL